MCNADYIFLLIGNKSNFYEPGKLGPMLLTEHNSLAQGGGWEGVGWGGGVQTRDNPEDQISGETYSDFVLLIPQANVW